MTRAPHRWTCCQQWDEHIPHGQPPADLEQACLTLYIVVSASVINVGPETVPLATKIRCSYSYSYSYYRVTLYHVHKFPSNITHHLCKQRRIHPRPGNQPLLLRGTKRRETLARRQHRGQQIDVTHRA